MSVDTAAERDIMVDSQVRPNDVPDLAIQDAMRSLPREALLPPEKRYLAYADAQVEYAPGRWMLSPREVAKLLHALRPRAGERALAIAAPYAAAVLERMGLSVTRLDGKDLTAVSGTWPIIVCEGAVTPRPPAAWLAALAPEGRLAVVEREGPSGRAMLYLKIRTVHRRSRAVRLHRAADGRLRRGARLRVLGRRDLPGACSRRLSLGETERSGFPHARSDRTGTEHGRDPRLDPADHLGRRPEAGATRTLRRKRLLCC